MEKSKRAWPPQWASWERKEALTQVQTVWHRKPSVGSQALQCPALPNVLRELIPFHDISEWPFSVEDFSIDSLGSISGSGETLLLSLPVTQHLEAGLLERLVADSSQTHSCTESLPCPESSPTPLRPTVEWASYSLSVQKSPGLQTALCLCQGPVNSMATQARSTELRPQRLR